MKDIAASLYNAKNHWLVDQVEVDFPTKESLAGRELYLSSLSSRHIEEFSPATTDNDTNIEWHLADFHRLTIMFSILQSKLWASEKDQALIVEFLTQIIFEPDYQIYVGFEQGEAVSAALVSQNDSMLLLSDIVAPLGKTLEQSVASLLADKPELNRGQIWFEKR
ncbi:hypothetical protein [Vibrio hippocampi]|uniref:Flavodoxin n=1 Tax=Vibrio hippocampi TaxID=654686 RepID=A0ABM8ZM50_9VIBR|nr:hypothetical protein [Vibrio hippocampi]CAH0529576.1 hypothetical protein VHP8226_03331 [Vibrio hippocampi]